MEILYKSPQVKDGVISFKVPTYSQGFIFYVFIYFIFIRCVLTYRFIRKPEVRLLLCKDPFTEGL